MGISVVIPVAEGDDAWKELLPELTALSADDEIILSSKSILKDDLEIMAEDTGLLCHCFSQPSLAGRARQLNAGAKAGTKEFYWFLHCDSRVSRKAVLRLKKSIERRPQAIHFFNLKFLKDGPLLTAINERGAWLRSRILRLPFGDQGFCMHRVTFESLGGFCEKSAYGEDHLLIWKAHQRNIKLNCVGEALGTSARRYKTQGWLKTTGIHLFLTVKQAVPEFKKVLFSKYSVARIAK